MSLIEARCPICHRLLFRWAAPRAYAEGSEVTQTHDAAGSTAVEVRCSRCHSTITFSVPDGNVVGQIQPSGKDADRKFATI